MTLPLGRWRTARQNFKARTGPVNIVVIGDSICEGFNAGANTRTANMYVTQVGLDLAAIAGLTWCGRYMPTAASTCAFANAYGPWPETADPWTRGGSNVGTPDDVGLGLRSVKLAADADYVQFTAPSWATDIQIQYVLASGSAALEVTSNGVIVHTESIGSGDNVERTVQIPLVGSGNVVKATLRGALGYINVHGWVWRKDGLPPGTIIPSGTVAGNNTLGGSVTLSLASAATGDLMILLAGQSNGAVTPPALPTGWTAIDTHDGGSTHYRLCYRVKQGGDTTVVVAGSVLVNTDACMAAFTGATYGSVSAKISNNTNGTTIDPAGMTTTGGDASIIAVGGGGPSGPNPYTFPTGWLSSIFSSNSLDVGLARKTVGVLAGTTDPAVVTYGNNPIDRVVWQIDLTRTSGGAYTRADIAVLDSGHGGYGAYTYGNPQSSAGIGATSLDTNWSMFKNIADFKPDLVVIELGGNDGQANSGAGRTKADYKAGLTTIVTQLDAACGYAPDLLFVGIYYLLAGNYTGGGGNTYSTTVWKSYLAAMQELVASYGTRAAFVDLGRFITPIVTTPPTAFSTDGVHPDAPGHRQIGHIIADVLKADGCYQVKSMMGMGL